MARRQNFLTLFFLPVAAALFGREASDRARLFVVSTCAAIAEGFEVTVTPAGRCVLTMDEQRLRLSRLPDGRRSPQMVRTLEELEDCDSWVDAMPAPTAATIKALAAQFARAGTEGLENPNPRGDECGGTGRPQEPGLSRRTREREARVRLFVVWISQDGKGTGDEKEVRFR